MFLGLWLHPCLPCLPPSSHGHRSGFSLHIQWIHWYGSRTHPSPLSLEKEMATHSSIPAWKIPWTEEPGRLQPMGSQRAGQDWTTKQKSTIFMFTDHICKVSISNKITLWHYWWHEIWVATVQFGARITKCRVKGLVPEKGYCGISSMTSSKQKVWEKLLWNTFKVI